MELKIKDPGSALTHFIAMLAAMAAAAPLLVKAASVPGTMHLKALSVFIVSMILLYAASTVYHTFDISEHVNKLLRKIDHMMIFILIAGTYTPVCLIVLGNRSGYRMLSLVWGIAIVGIIINALWINCPSDRRSPDSCRFRLAPRRRDHLHDRRRDLRSETADLQLKAQKLRLPRDLPPLRHGRKLLPLHDDVRICGSCIKFS